MKKLKKDIADRAFEPVYLIYGPEAYLRRSMKLALKNALVGDDTMNYTYREGKDVVIPEIREMAETLPFFADRRLILLENSGLLKKGGEALAEYLPEMPESTVLVLVEEEVDKRSRLFKAIGKCGYAAECTKPSEDELKKYALAGFTKGGRRITADALELFVDRCGDDLNHLLTEQEKLIAYTAGKDGIRLPDVEAVTSVTAQNRVFDMLDYMAAGKPREAFALYEDLMALKEPPMRILFLITQQVNRLLQVKELAEQGYRTDAIAEAAGLRPFAVKKYLHQAGAFTAEKLRARLEKMVEYDTAIKSGEMTDALALELIFTEFSGKYD